MSIVLLFKNHAEICLLLLLSNFLHVMKECEGRQRDLRPRVISHKSVCSLEELFKVSTTISRLLQTYETKREIEEKRRVGGRSPKYSV